MMNKNIFCGFVLSLILFLGAAAQDSKPDFSPAIRMIKDAMKKDAVPSFAVAAVKNGRIVWEEGFGFADTARRIRATSHTTYYIASVIKSITASAIMILRERGQLNLDQPINIYLGEDSIRSPLWDVRAATVRRIATHSAGITTFDFRSFTQPARNLLTLEQAIERYGFLCWPPDRFDYSNLDYGILTKAIEHITQESFGSFLEKEIFQPLHMTHTFIDSDQLQKPITARSYSYHDGPRPMISSIALGASGGFASVHDLALFALWQMKSPSVSVKKILADTSIDFMHEQTVPTGFGGEVQQYGIGWWIGENSFGYKTVTAQGGTEDASAFVQLIPSEKIAIVLLANKGTDATGAIVDKISAVLTNAGHRKENIGRNRQEQAASSPLLPDSLTGNWKGFIETYRGKVELLMSVDKSGKATIRLGGTSVRQLDPMSFDSTSRMLYTRSDGILGILPDIGSDPYVIEFSLYAHDGLLTGSATSNPKGSKKLFAALSYWTQLSKL